MTNASDSAAEKKPVTAVVTLRVAGRDGPTFTLDAAVDNVIGRATEATITVPDRLASRAHAAIRYHTVRHEWILRDVGSRNGTWLNGRRIDVTPIMAGAVIRIGTSELIFQEAGDEAEADPREEGPLSGVRVVRTGPLDQLEAAVLKRQSGSHADEAVHPLVLYDVSMRLVATHSRADVVASALHLAKQHCPAISAGWFHVAQDLGLEPVSIVPSDCGLMELIVEPARTTVPRDGHVVWLAHESMSPGGFIRGMDVVCVPILEQGRARAVLAVAVPHGKLRGPEFGMLVVLARLAAAACDRLTAATVAAPVPKPAADDHHTIDFDEPVAHAKGGSQITGDGTILLGHPEPHPPAGAAGHSAPPIHVESMLMRVPTLKLTTWQRLLIVEALRRHGGNLAEAARELGVETERLHQALARHGLVKQP